LPAAGIEVNVNTLAGNGDSTAKKLPFFAAAVCREAAVSARPQGGRKSARILLSRCWHPRRWTTIYAPHEGGAAAGGSEVYPRFSRAGLDEIRFGECLVCVDDPAKAGRPNDGFPVVFFDKW